MNRIKCLRKAHGLSQAQFAELFNVGQTAVSNWEIGKNSIDVGIIQEIAKRFDVSQGFVLGDPFGLKRPREEWFADEIADYKNAPDIVKPFLEFRYGHGDCTIEREPDFKDVCIRILFLLKKKSIKKAKMLTDLRIDEKLWGKCVVRNQLPPNSILDKIANYFNVSVEYLLGQESTIEPSERIDRLALYGRDGENEIYDLSPEEAEAVKQVLIAIKVKKKEV